MRSKEMNEYREGKEQVRRREGRGAREGEIEWEGKRRGEKERVNENQRANECCENVYNPCGGKSNCMGEREGCD